MLQLDVFSIIALVLGTVWVTVNLYTFGPVYRRAFVRALGRPDGPRIYDEGTALADEDLPTIDVLLPAYDEDETIRHSIRSIRAADYPADKLAINVLVEAEDRATRDELARLRHTYAFRELVIPPGYPGARNKPRALDYGFAHTSGDLVGILDAEDVVDPQLFRQVVAALVDGGHDYVQGKLDMQNEDDGFLNAVFRGEYGLWYGFVIPSFFRVRYPVPLGGTTNFFHRSVLESIAVDRSRRFGRPWSPAEQEALADRPESADVPWDPRNVTEDFELGLLLWESGYEMAMLTAVTKEESPLGLNAWIRQRTRWQKGKLYTFIGRLRHPPSGAWRKLHVYGQSAMPHLGPINILGVVVLTMYANIVGILSSPIVTAVLLIGAAFVIQQLIIQATAYAAVTDQRGGVLVRRIAYNAVGLPLYWLLLWGSDLRAFVQLAFDHLHWEKTTHFGRHVLETVTPEASSDSGDTGPIARVFETESGWLWEIRERGDVVARAGAPAANESAARTSLATFLDVLPVALDGDAVFRVERVDEEWWWTFDAPDRVATGGTSFPDEAAALESVGRTKVAAGAASVEGPPIRLEADHEFGEPVLQPEPVREAPK